MKEILDTIQGCEISKEVNADGFEEVDLTADADVDCDGSGGNLEHDPYFQADTTLHYKGRALNAYEVPFAVVPPIVIRRTKGVVLGCRVLLTNLRNGKKVEAVIGDIGPTRKVGEVSVEAAIRLGLSGNPNHGGTSDKIIRYQIFPGIPAVVDGVKYELQRHQH